MKSTISLDQVNLISNKLDQLSALLSVGMCDDFSTHSTKIQSDYLWACASITHEIAAIFRGKHEEVQE